MSRITKDLETWFEPNPAPWPGWVPLVALPAIVLPGCGQIPRWIFMWMLALAVGFGCKWLTWWEGGRIVRGRTLAYFLAWPGMDAPGFLVEALPTHRPKLSEWIAAIAKTLAGATLIFFAMAKSSQGPGLLVGWVGLTGMALVLHFGIFHLLALAWRTNGIDVKPIMQAPVIAKSVGEFWDRRWNTAFNQLVFRHVFRPLARQVNIKAACMAAFLVSGLIHDLVISIPAGGGYGWPTAYFMLQGGAVLFERSAAGRLLGLRQGWRGWLFAMLMTAGPAGLVFHPPFIHNVILPMLTALGAFVKGPMKTVDLKTLLQIAGLLHLGLIGAGLLMPRVVRLRSHISSLPPFIGKLFWVYYTFIGLSLISFGLITFAYAGTLANGGGLARAICFFLALFWTIRLVAAAFIFDVRPYLTTGLLRLGYWATNVVFTFLPFIYIYAALK